MSHDREFVNSLSTRILAFEDDKLIDYPGNLEEFEAWKKEQKRQEKKKKK